MPISAIMTPAIAGPIKRARLKTTELIARADASDVRSTRLGTSASRAGWAMPLQPPADQRYAVAADVDPIIALSEGAGDVVEPGGGTALLLKSQGMRTPISGHAPGCIVE